MRRACLLAATLLLWAAPATAGDWPFNRHDPQRTAYATGTSDISSPALRWRHYLGGELAATAYLTWDVDGDALEEAVYIAGGKVIAKKPNGVLLWETAPYGLTNIDGVRDFDGDGVLEAIVWGVRGRTMIVSLADGAVLWRMPAGRI